jgi:hypothetical protein
MLMNEQGITEIARFLASRGLLKKMFAKNKCRQKRHTNPIKKKNIKHPLLI